MATTRPLPIINLESDVIGTLPVDNGGTESAVALNNNRIMISSGGEVVEHSSLTANRILLSNASGLPTSNAAVTASRAMVSDSNGFPTQSTITTSQLASTLYWTKYSVTYTQLSAAAATNDIELFSLSAKTMIHRVVIKHSTSFDGGLITTYTLSVGIVGSLAKYIAAFNVRQAPGNAVFGVSSTSINATLEDFASATSIRVAAVSTVIDLDQATQGAADIWVLTSLLP